MSETVGHCSQILTPKEISENKTVTSARHNASRKFAITHDSGMIVASKLDKKLAKLRSSLPVIHPSNKASKTQKDVNKSIIYMCSRLS